MLEKLYEKKIIDDYMLVKGNTVCLGYIKKITLLNGLIIITEKFALIR